MIPPLQPFDQCAQGKPVGRAGFGDSSGHGQGLIVDPGGQQLAGQWRSNQTAGAMAAVDVQTVEPRAGRVGDLPGILAQYAIRAGELFRVRQRADDEQVIRAGATERGPALEGVRVELLVTDC